MDYREFISSKQRDFRPVGFDVPVDAINQRLHPWQRLIVKFALRAGRAALFEDCGLGKTLQQLEWSRFIVERTSKPVILFCPIAVAEQTIAEAAKFSIDCQIRRVAKASDVGPGINVTNYEKLHHFDPSVFGGVVLDESSILKAWSGKTRQELTEAFSNTEYRLACTATPAPNDRMELGNHSEFLGVLPSSEMLERWFINDTMKAGGYRLRRHAERDFWRWMSGWAVCISKPSDLGFSDDGYILPELRVHEIEVECDRPPPGMLFHAGGSVSATSVHKEKRRALAERVRVVADLANNSEDAWAIWCDTNYEADELRKAIPSAVEVRGSQGDEQKERLLSSFSRGESRSIITKAEIAGFGLNWQHCHKTTWFAGYSFERWYQAMRRLYRYGQEHDVDCHCVATEGEQSIVDVVKRKQADHAKMFSEMAEMMRDGMLENVVGDIRPKPYMAKESIKIPAWLQTKG